MEPNNIENDFRKKLNNRKIQPSAKAWDRLDAMLAVADSSHSEQAKQKPKRNRNWMYMAACFLGFILIATVFLTQDQEMIDVAKETVVLENPAAEIQNRNIQNPEIILEEAESSIVSAKTEKYNGNVTLQKDGIASTEKVSNNITKSRAVMVETIAEKQSPSETDHTITQPEEKAANRYVNVDELLASVEPTPKKEKLFKKESGIKVDSNSLLSEVDGELELSFREKVIQSVSKNYQEIKVALGNRNLKD